MVDFKAKNIRLVIAFDVGHGESAAYAIIIRDSEGNLLPNVKVIPLLVKENTPKIYSTISYLNGQINIGTRDSEAIAYFKRSPLEWDKVISNGKTSKELMSDFISKFIESVLAPGLNTEISGFKKDEIALFVGCPSDKTWTNTSNINAYEKLIEKASGVKNVCVIAESTAAIFSAIRSNVAKNIHPQKGVAVFDWGSSTSDFTYISLGKAISEISWTLGASAIEANIVEKALSYELGDEVDTVWQGDIIIRQLKSRAEHKEAWYGDNVNIGYVKTNPDGVALTMQYAECDEFGKPIMRTSKSGVSTVKQNMFQFDLDCDFMDDVVKKMPIPNVKEKGLPVCEKPCSWYEYCEKFLLRCQKLLEEHELECETVVLTGGASRMPFIKDLATKVFTGKVKNIICDEAPSYCVCNGLCQVALNKFNLMEMIDKEKREIASALEKNALKPYKDSLVQSLADFVYEKALEVYRRFSMGSQSVKIKDLQVALDEEIKDSLESRIPFIRNVTSGEFNKNCVKKLVETSGKISQALYGNSGDIFNINEDIAGSLGLTSLNTSLNVKVDITGYFNNLFDDILDVIEGLLAISVIGIPIALIIEAFRSRRDENSTVTPSQITTLCNHVNSNKNTFIQKFKPGITKSVEDSLENTLGKNNVIFNTTAEDVLEKVVKTVALEYFENVITE